MKAGDSIHNDIEILWPQPMGEKVSKLIAKIEEQIPENSLINDIPIRNFVNSTAEEFIRLRGEDMSVITVDERSKPIVDRIDVNIQILADRNGSPLLT